MPPTTANAHRPRPFRARRLVQALLAGFAVAWVAAAVAPVDRREWLLEQVLTLSVLAFLALSYRRLQLSDASYLALAAFLALHTWGARWGYEAAPLPVDATLLGLGGTGAARNNFDRLVHLAFGLLVAYPLRELWLWRERRSRLWASLLAAMTIVALGALYEVVEWIAAALVAPGLGRAFVGAQGDAWDAQKDVALAAMGALLSMAATEVGHRVLAAAAPWRYRHPPPAPWATETDDERLGGPRRVA